MTTEASPRSRRRRANLERILDSATRIAVVEGLDALSVKRVADEADYTPGALYRYFPSKDALLSGVVSRVIGDLTERLRRVDAGAPPDAPLTRVLLQARAYRAYSVDVPHGFRLLAMIFAEPRVLLAGAAEARTVMAAMTAAMESTGDALERAAQAGLLTGAPLAERVMALFASLTGTLLLRKQERMAPGLIDADRMAADVVRALLLGWGAPTGALRSAVDEADTLDVNLLSGAES